MTIVSPTFGKFGGIESFVFALAQFLSGRPEIAKVTVCFKRVGKITLGPLFEAKLAAAPFECVVTGTGSPELFKSIAKADVVHCQNPLFDTALIARLLRKNRFQYALVR